MIWPFAGVMADRPYPPTGLTTARWRAEVGTELVPFAGLWLTQTGVDILALFGSRPGCVCRTSTRTSWTGRVSGCLRTVIAGWSGPRSRVP